MWLLSGAVRIVHFAPVCGCKRFHQLAREIIAKPGNSMLLPAEEATALGAGGFLVSSLPEDDESTAAAAMLVSKVQEKIMEFTKVGIRMLVDLAPSLQQTFKYIDEASALVVVLGPRSLESAEQLSCIAYGTTRPKHMASDPSTVA